MTLPRILIVDDQYGDAEDDTERDLFLESTNTELIDLDTKDHLLDQHERRGKIAGAVFCSGQEITSGKKINSYEIIRECVSKGWGEKKKWKWALVLLDVRFTSDEKTNDENFGLDVRLRLLRDFPGIPIVILTSKHEEELHLEDEKQHDEIPFLPKPTDELTEQQKKTYLLEVLMKYVNYSGSQINKLLSLNENIACSPTTIEVFLKALRVAPTTSHVLLLGESGVGKEIFAKYIHNMSDRRYKEFVSVNCAAIPDNLLESTLFGHEKGSFTGSIKKKAGKFELAEEGTIFLDEIGELSEELQSKLLRVLNNGEYERVGGGKIMHSKARVIAATNRDITPSNDHNKFREDLYYRLSKCSITIHLGIDC